jgi:hypothetical protein
VCYNTGMTTVSEDEFLKWAAEKGLRIDPHYPHSAVLTFDDGSDSRFWSVPPDHHDVIHADFRSEKDVERWVGEMSKRGFDLPDDLPDATFKRPSWM